MIVLSYWNKKQKQTLVNYCIIKLGGYRMIEKIKDQLLNFSVRRKTIKLSELEKLLTTKMPYQDFAGLILPLETDGILNEIAAQGRNNRQPSLAYGYRISRHKLYRTYYKELQQYRHKFHASINLDAYYKLDYTVWRKDLPFLKLINKYLKENGIPKDKAPAPERSFEIVNNEKWIEEGGIEVLHRTKLYDTLNIYPVSDPLMFAVNPKLVAGKYHYHLIIENKTTYQALLPILPKSMFSTLIYGVGNKITKNIENFPSQFPVKGEHRFLYFGDIDRSGITIWHSLQKRQESLPATPFYEACLRKRKAYGKTNQTLNEEALQSFLTYFSEEMSERIKSLLSEGAYFPQEVLRTKELQTILLQTNWREIIGQRKETNVHK